MEMVRELDRAQSALFFCINFFDEFSFDEEATFIKGFSGRIKPWDTWESIVSRYGDIDLTPGPGDSDRKFKITLIDQIRYDYENYAGTLIFDSVMRAYCKTYTEDEYPHMIYTDTTEVDGKMNKGQYILKQLFETIPAINNIVGDDYGILARPSKDFNSTILLKFIGTVTVGIKVTAENAKSQYEVDEAQWMSEALMRLIVDKAEMTMFDIMYLHVKEAFELKLACSLDTESLN